MVYNLHQQQYTRLYIGDILTMPQASVSGIETAFTIDVRTPLVRANIL